jgi:hypothetical protein
VNIKMMILYEHLRDQRKAGGMRLELDESWERMEDSQDNINGLIQRGYSTLLIQRGYSTVCLLSVESGKFIFFFFFLAGCFLVCTFILNVTFRWWS